MTTISLEGIRIHAFHGFYEEERILGNEYVLDVHISADTTKAAQGDDLFSTINYELVYHICTSEMKKPKKLIETVAKCIIDRLNEQFEQIQGVKVRVKKMNPPLGGRVDAAAVELSSGIFDLPSIDNLKKIQELKL